MAGRLVIAGLLVLTLSVPRAAFIALHRQDLRAQAADANAREASGQSLTKTSEAARDEWVELMEEFEPDRQVMQEKVGANRGGYWDLMARRAPLVGPLPA